MTVPPTCWTRFLLSLTLAAGLATTARAAEMHGGAYRDPGEPVPPSMVAGPITGAPTAPVPSSAILIRTVSDPLKPGHARAAALEDLAMGTSPLPLGEIRKVRNHVRPAQLSFYARCLVRCGPGALKDLRELAEHHKPLVRAEAIYSVIQLDASGGEAFARQVLQDKNQPEEARVAALRGLFDRDSGFARVSAIRILPTATGPLFQECLAVFRGKPEPEDPGYLIEVMSQRDGRIANEAVRALQNRTGYRIGKDPKTWRFHYLQHQAAESAFQVNTPDRPAETVTANFLGIPVLGERVVFLIDMSGSMTGGLASNAGQTRGQRALLELEATLKRLPASTTFNVIGFADAPAVFVEREVVKARKTTPAAVLAWLQTIPFNGKTDLHAALDLAFGVSNLEEIFILSDGVPSVGAIQDLDRLRGQVGHWNRWRNIRINAVAMGAPLAARDFLQRMSESTDGNFRVVN